MATSLNSTSEHDLVRKLQQGDRVAFAELYERYKSAIYTYCLRLLEDHKSAEDTTHETFLKMFDECRSLRSPESLRPWLFRIARNEAFTRIRKSRRNGHVGGEEDIWDADTLALLGKYRGFPDTLLPVNVDGRVILGDFKIPVMKDGSLFVFTRDAKSVPTIFVHYDVSSDTLLFSMNLKKSSSLESYRESLDGRMVFI